MEEEKWIVHIAAKALSQGLFMGEAMV